MTVDAAALRCKFGNSWVGRIGDVLVYDSSASVNDLGQTGQALAERYGLTWDNSVLVPEPSALLLLGLGLTVVLRRRR